MCTAQDRRALQPVIETAQINIGTHLLSISDIGGKRRLSRAQSIVTDNTHPTTTSSPAAVCRTRRKEEDRKKKTTTNCRRQKCSLATCSYTTAFHWSTLCCTKGNYRSETVATVYFCATFNTWNWRLANRWHAIVNLYTTTADSFM